jgi:VanZ family protein
MENSKPHSNPICLPNQRERSDSKTVFFKSAGRVVINRRLLNILAVIYGILLVYASLMPFDFGSNVYLTAELTRLWNSWSISIPAHISGSDVASNLVLYFPLGYILALRLRISRSSACLPVFASTMICSALSAGIEIVQLTLASRTSSAFDWILNSLSGCAGAVAGVLWGVALCIAIVEWLQTAWQKRPIDIATIIILGLLAADALSPFLPTILPKQVYRNIRSAQLNPWEAINLQPWHWWLFIRVAPYGILTILLAAWGECVRPALVVWTKAAFWVFGFALCLESSKLLIVSRTFNIANIATSLIGCGMGVLIGRHLAGKVSVGLKAELACVGILLYVLYLAWTPFNFAWITDISKRVNLSPVAWLPFYSYAMGSGLNHVRLFVQSVLLMGLFTYFLRLRFPWFEKRSLGLPTAILLSTLLGMVAEGGQVFLMSRWPSMTDIYCFALGGGLGMWIKRPASHRITDASSPS